MKISRLRKRYSDEIAPALMKEFKITNRLAAPRLDKIVINMGVGDGAEDIKILEVAISELAQITGQKPLTTRARKAIAGFKIRKDLPVGCKVTLRGDRMYEFLDRLVNIVLPRIRDFRGVPARSFDRAGNYSMGIKEQLVFPEIDHDGVKRTQGMDITINTTGESRDEAYRLLELFGMPFEKKR